MAKMYFYKYKDMIGSGEESLANVLNFYMDDIPARWRSEVIEMLTHEYSE